jgi:hypothetical protein
VSPLQGIASVTTFTFASTDWIDPDGISEYRFFYSLDNGDTYIPLDQASIATSKTSFIFPPIFSSTKVTLRCNVKSLKGFFADAYTTFPLAMKSSSSASAVLDSFTLNNVNSEAGTLQAAS